jgi:hypothetical protein
MANILPEPQIIQILHELFPDLTVKTRIVQYVGPIHAFFIKFPSSENLDNNWEPLSNAIAVYYQTQLNTEFEIWNLYLFCITDVDVDKSIKYKIENDTVSSRKILITNGGDIHDDFIDQIIIEHITNENLKLIPDEKLAENVGKGLEKDPLIWQAIVSTGMVSGKKINEDKSAALLEELEKQIKNEVQKS